MKLAELNEHSLNEMNVKKKERSIFLLTIRDGYLSVRKRERDGMGEK